MKTQIVTIHLLNRNISEPRVEIDRRTDDLRNRHLRTYTIKSKARFNRLLRLLDTLRGTSTACYPEGFTVLWSRYREEPKAVYFMYPVA